MAFPVRQKLSDNIAALRIALSRKGDEQPDAEQMEVLRKYAGFGGIKQVMYGSGSREEWKQQEKNHGFHGSRRTVVNRQFLEPSRGIRNGRCN